MHTSGQPRTVGSRTWGWTMHMEWAVLGASASSLWSEAPIKYAGLSGIPPFSSPSCVRGGGGESVTW